jgi:hypothetical protein
MLSPTAAKADLLTSIGPILDYLDSLGSWPSAETLNADFPIDGSIVTSLREKVLAGLEAGWLTPREANGLRFGRVAKSTPDSFGFTIDAVDMCGPGPGHTHPEGEFDLCFALTPNARFDGSSEGWVVYPPGSWHVPTVSEGRMVIFYFLPNGAIRFQSAPS